METALEALIVEDQVSLRSAVAFEFENNGFNVTEADGGDEAFRIAMEKRFDVIVSDIKMPKGSGLELLGNLRAADHSYPPVVLMTAYSDISTEAALDKGACRVISKPFKGKEIISAARAAVNLDKKWDARFDSELTSRKLDFAFSTPLGESVVLGRGGVFIPLIAQFPNAGSILEISLNFRTGSLNQIDFVGEVAWVRCNSESLLKPGIGVEFLSILQPSSQDIRREIDQLDPIAYIPLGKKQE
jgi:CheY-like chemotaxis protein/Tfp pilus assembly protein PilZ